MPRLNSYSSLVFSRRKAFHYSRESRSSSSGFRPCPRPRRPSWSSGGERCSRVMAVPAILASAAVLEVPQHPQYQPAESWVHELERTFEAMDCAEQDQRLEQLAASSQVRSGDGATGLVVQVRWCDGDGWRAEVERVELRWRSCYAGDPAALAILVQKVCVGDGAEGLARPSGHVSIWYEPISCVAELGRGEGGKRCRAEAPEPYKRTPRLRGKLRSRWDGPYTVVKVFDNGALEAAQQKLLEAGSRALAMGLGHGGLMRCGPLLCRWKMADVADMLEASGRWCDGNGCREEPERVELRWRSCYAGDPAALAILVQKVWVGDGAEGLARPSGHVSIWYEPISCVAELGRGEGGKRCRVEAPGTL
ncbi:hypothetical protein Taro_042153 [Colocasia esculenta]|uniref:Uncharacterized protein n=1 Tax=Colocasia esculenta TaxID=4460 RepID=A0A843WN90_COLES|nr:hypothetical protein [Colocasia esculenta]